MRILPHLYDLLWGSKADVKWLVEADHKLQTVVELEAKCLNMDVAIHERPCALCVLGSLDFTDRVLQSLELSVGCVSDLTNRVFSQQTKVAVQEPLEAFEMPFFRVKSGQLLVT